MFTNVTPWINANVFLTNFNKKKEILKYYRRDHKTQRNQHYSAAAAFAMIKIWLKLEYFHFVPDLCIERYFTHQDAVRKCNG